MSVDLGIKKRRMQIYNERYFDDDFNSRIDYQDLTLGIHDYVLTLQLRIWLRQKNPPPGRDMFNVEDGFGNTAPCYRWDAGEWTEYKRRFKAQVYLSWNDAFMLIPPKSYDGFLDPDGNRLNVRCFVQLVLVDADEPDVHIVDVVRLARPFLLLRSEAGSRGSPGLFTSEDVNPRTRHGQLPRRPEAGNYTWTQNVLSHEVGHLLKLEHINQDSASCKKAVNSTICYGGGLDQLNIMGKGDQLDLRDADPWLDRIPLHTPGTLRRQWKADFVNSSARLRGLWSLRSE